MLEMSSDLATWLIQRLEERSWPLRELARKTGISHTSIARYTEGTRIPGPDACKKIARVLNIPVPEIMRIAGHLPPVPETIAQEEEILIIFRTLPGNTRDVILQMLRGLATPSYTISARPITALAELPPTYQIQTIGDQIAALIEQYPDLGPLLVQAQRDLPEHATQALIHNIEIWIEKEQTENFVNLHRALTDFFIVQGFLKKKEKREE